MSGWYRMHRGWMESGDFKPEPFTEREAFLWSIEGAAFERHARWFNGHQIVLERGQLVTSLRAMTEAFGWTIKRTRGFIERMGKCQKWAHQTAHTHCVITVCNYDEYQSTPDGEGHSEGQAEGTVRAQSGHSEGTQDKKEEEGLRSKYSADAESARPAVEAIAAFAKAVMRLRDKPRTVEAVGLWNRHAGEAGWRKVGKLTAQRRDKLRLRLKEVGYDGWVTALERARASDLLGINPPTWWHFDFLIKNEDHIQRLLEGNYDRRGRNGSGGGWAHVPQRDHPGDDYG